MFDGLGNIIEIDLSNFDFSHVTAMFGMFHECTSLKSIKFGDINTSRVNNMQGLFYNCESLTSINLSKFDTSSVTTFAGMFSFCKEIISIDASSFKATNALEMNDMLAYCDNLVSINLPNFDTSKVSNMQGAFSSCPKIKYINFQYFNDTSLSDNNLLFSGCSNLLYLNLRSFMKIKYYVNTNLLIYPFSLEASSNIKFCIEDLGTKNKVIGDKTNDCSDLCFQENVIFDINKSECVCEENFKFEYNNSCYQDCPAETQRIFQNKYICSPNIPENFYLDNSDNIYKECYSLCKRCNQSGNDENNNCLECKDNYRLINDSFSISNKCYSQCSNYSYFTGFDQYYCSENCNADVYNKTIEDKKNVLMNAKMIMNISMNMITYAIKIVQKIKKLM